MSCALSVVVVVHDMARELPRTLRTLDPTYQRQIEADDYEVIVVDNGSAVPVDRDLVRRYAGNIRMTRLDPAPASPARAANRGIQMAQGELIGLIVDGARMASPALLATTRLGARLADRPVITSPAYHLGAVRHMDATAAGYNQAFEDRLLEAADWEADGYLLLGMSALAGSCGRGWFGPMGESSALFMPAPMWNELGGLDERFAMPGGGLVNHDLYHRACHLDRAQLVVLLGEGTFHQIHGGAATSRRFDWSDMAADYEAVTGRRHRPPDVPALYIGTLPPTGLPHLQRSVEWLVQRATTATPR